ncbi:SusD/RagB family nutrient-binding outer membrane lipoprotein, partial [Leeuwenhoekiella blandensis]
MKKIYNVLFIAFLSAFTVFQSCETVELEMLENPNSLSPDQANPSLLFNSVQLSYRNGVASFNNIGAQLGRIDYMSDRIYFNAYGSGTMNGPWGNLFSSMNPDIAVIEESNTDGSYDYILGASKAMQAHLMMLLVDYIGDIVWTEANMPLEFPNPQLDDDAAVYEAAISLLDEASALLQGSSAGTATDLYYEGDASKWIKFINTLKMRAALTTGDYNGVINATNVIESADDNFAFAYGTNLQQPDTRHPDYASDYTDSGAGLYR